MPATTSDPTREHIDNFLAIPLPGPDDPLAQRKLLYFGWTCVTFAETWRRGAPAEFARIRGHMARIQAAAKAVNVLIPPRWLELVPDGGIVASMVRFEIEPPAEVSLAPVPPRPGETGAPTDPVVTCKIMRAEPGRVTVEVILKDQPLAVHTEVLENVGTPGTTFRWTPKDRAGNWVRTEYSPVTLKFIPETGFPITRQVTLRPWARVEWGTKRLFTPALLVPSGGQHRSGDKVEVKLADHRGGYPEATEVHVDVFQALPNNAERLVEPKPRPLRTPTTIGAWTAPGAPPLEFMIPVHRGAFESPYYFARVKLKPPGGDFVVYDTPRDSREALAKMIYAVGILANPDGTLTHYATQEADGFKFELAAAPLADPLGLGDPLYDVVKLDEAAELRWLVHRGDNSLLQVAGKGQISPDIVVEALEGTFFYLYSGHGNAMCLDCEQAGRTARMKFVNPPIASDRITVRDDPTNPTFKIVTINDPEIRRWGAIVKAEYSIPSPTFAPPAPPPPPGSRMLLPFEFVVPIGCAVPYTVDVRHHFSPPIDVRFEKVSVELKLHTNIGCGGAWLNAQGEVQRCTNTNPDRFAGCWDLGFEPLPPGADPTTPKTMISVRASHLSRCMATPPVLGMSCCFTAISNDFVRTAITKGTRYAWGFRTPVYSDDAVRFTQKIVANWKEQAFSLGKFKEVFYRTLSHDPAFARMQPRLIEAAP
jgi:hypothetical protein